jgi:hypothetical protein
MLILGVLEENFISTRIQGSMKNISVYVGKGKNLPKLTSSRLSIYLSHGVPSDRVQ